MGLGGLWHCLWQERLGALTLTGCRKGWQDTPVDYSERMEQNAFSEDDSGDYTSRRPTIFQAEADPGQLHQFRGAVEAARSPRPKCIER